MTLDEAINSALDFVDNGDFASADFVYQQILALYPNHRVVTHLSREVCGALSASRSGTFSQKKLLSAFKTSQSHYSAVPEYNLNWSPASLESLDSFLFENSIVVVDIGAREGFLGEIEGLKKYVDYVGFDADEMECDRINASPPIGFRTFQILPFFIGRDEGEIDFHIYRSPGESSVFYPKKSFVDQYRADFEIQKTVKVLSIDLDSALEKREVPTVDFLKLDTQGSELSILKAAKARVDRILLIESEIEFVEMYEGQPLIGEFLAYMHDTGFEVLYLNRVFSNRQSYGGESRGQITFCDVLFAKREEFLTSIDPVLLAKHLILLCSYGHLDRAYSIWVSNPALMDLLPGLDGFFQPYNLVSNRMESMGRDKLLCWQLHQRRTNKLPFDSDRSWPFR